MKEVWYVFIQACLTISTQALCTDFTSSMKIPSWALSTCVCQCHHFPHCEVRAPRLQLCSVSRPHAKDHSPTPQHLREPPSRRHSIVSFLAILDLGLLLRVILSPSIRLSLTLPWNLAVDIGSVAALIGILDWRSGRGVFDVIDELAVFERETELCDGQVEITVSGGAEC